MIFEGEYLNDIKWIGNIKEINNRTIIEGKYVNGLFEGKIIKFDFKKIKLFEEEYNDGQKNKRKTILFKW